MGKKNIGSSFDNLLAEDAMPAWNLTQPQPNATHSYRLRSWVSLTNVPILILSKP